MEKRIKYNKNDNPVIADVRFQNEVDIIHSWEGIVIKVVRPINNNKNNDKVSENVHISEIGIDSIKNYDYLIINDGTLEELYQKVENVISKI